MDKTHAHSLLTSKLTPLEWTTQHWSHTMPLWEMSLPQVPRPPIIQVNEEVFAPEGPYRVNTYATLAAAWANADPADTHLWAPCK